MKNYGKRKKLAQKATYCVIPVFLFVFVLAQKHTWKPIEYKKTLPQTHTTAAIWFSTKEPKICVREKIASSTNSAGKTEFPPAEDWNSIPIWSLVLVSVHSVFVFETDWPGSPDCPQTQGPLASTSLLLGLQVCATTPSLTISIKCPE
jgi:hypothetical protein